MMVICVCFPKVSFLKVKFVPILYHRSMTITTYVWLCISCPCAKSKLHSILFQFSTVELSNKFQCLYFIDFLRMGCHGYLRINENGSFYDSCYDFKGKDYLSKDIQRFTFLRSVKGLGTYKHNLWNAIHGTVTHLKHQKHQKIKCHDV